MLPSPNPASHEKENAFVHHPYLGIVGLNFRDLFKA